MRDPLPGMKQGQMSTDLRFGHSSSEADDEEQDLFDAEDVLEEYESTSDNYNIDENMIIDATGIEIP